MNKILEESKKAEASNAAAVAREAEHNALAEMVRTQLEQQTSRIYQRMDDIERSNNERFEAGDRRMDMLATKKDLEALRSLFIDPITGQSKLADKQDIAMFNTYVNNFTVASRVLSTGGRWIYRTLIVIAIIIGATSLIMSGIKGAGANLVHWFAPTP